MNLLDPFLYDFVAEHHRALREAAEGLGTIGARGRRWWSPPAATSTVPWSRSAVAVAARALLDRRLLGCRHACATR
jgi:hypothetical protein